MDQSYYNANSVSLSLVRFESRLLSRFQRAKHLSWVAPSMAFHESWIVPSMKAVSYLP
jgi:hypothetical protein